MIAGVAGYAVNGVLTRYPELGPLMDRYLNDEGKRYLAATADECIGQSVENWENWENTDTRTLMVDGRSLAEILQQDPQVNAVFTGPNYRLDDRALNAPMLLINALHDDTIPYGQARELADAYPGARRHCRLRHRPAAGDDAADRHEPRHPDVLPGRNGLRVARRPVQRSPGRGLTPDVHVG